MINFVYGTDYQYRLLKNDLADSLCHVYYHRTFPASFSRHEGRIGFEYNPKLRVYILYIDSGITCSHPRASWLLKMWLRDGLLRFDDYNDLKQFLKGLSYLY